MITILTKTKTPPKSFSLPYLNFLSKFSSIQLSLFTSNERSCYRTSRYYFSGLRVSRLGRDVSRSPVKSLEVLVLFPWDLECHAFSVMYREALSTIEKPSKITRSPFSYSLGVRVPTKGDVSRTPLTLFIPKPLLEFFAQQKDDQSEEQHQERTPKLSKFRPEDV